MLFYHVTVLHAENDEMGCVLEISLGESKYWIPECDASIKLVIGQTFESLDTALQLYRTYAKEVDLMLDYILQDC